MKISVKLVALIAIMGALGNVLGLIAIRLPSVPGTNLEFHLSVLPALLLAISIGPLSGAMTGALSTIIVTMNIGNIFIPFGNALFVGVAGLLHKKFNTPPPVSAILALIPYAPYMWLASTVYNVPDSFIAIIIVKALIEVLIAGTLIEFILFKKTIKKLLITFR